MRSLCYILVCLCLCLMPLAGQPLFRGAFEAFRASDGARLQAPGEPVQAVAATDLPFYLSGRFEGEAGGGEEIFLVGSNRIRLGFFGSGVFAVERFEQVLESEAPGSSRMIISLQRGEVAIDARDLSAGSQVILESPVGRLSAGGDRFLMRLQFDERSGIFDFSIAVHSGAVRFTDRRGERYTVRSGQRLNGAGKSQAPAIEIGELREEDQERRAYLDAVFAPVDARPFDMEAFRGSMVAMSVAVNEAAEPPEAASEEAPILIDYAGKPASVVPFRAEARPPADWEVDLF